MQIGLGLSITAQLRFGSAISLSSYAVNGFDPSLVFDFEQNYYRTGGTDSTLSSSVTHAATSNATMTDSDGNIKWRPHNLLTYSEDFTNGAWNKISASATANAGIAPDGSNNATKLQLLGPVAYVGQTGLNNASAATFTVKYINNQWIMLNFGGGGSTAVWFDIQNGLVGTEASGYSGSIVDIGNGWYECTILASTILTSSFIFPCVNSDGVYDGTVSKSCYVYNAHAYRNDLGGMANNPAQPAGLETYVPTTSSAVYLPRVGHHIYNGSAWVNEGVLHESEARTNLAIYSEDFSQWTKGSITTVTAGFASPDGGSNAYRLEMAQTNGTFMRLSTTLVSGSDYTFSIYVKDNGTGTGSQFILDTGQVGGGPLITATDEWVRYSITFTAPSSTVFANIDNGTHSSGTDLLIYGAQVELGSTPSSYIPTSGSTVTRAAETLTVPAANMPWPTPVEVTGTELVTNGTFNTDLTGWVTSSADWTWDASARAHLNTTSNYQRISYDTGYATGGMQAGVLYLIEFDYELVSGRFKFSLNSTNSYATTVTTLGSGRFSLQIVRPADNRTDEIQIRNETATTELYIDNVTIKEINPLSVSIQMDGKMTYADTSNGQEVSFLNWSRNTNNFINARLDTVGIRTGEVKFYQRDQISGQDIVGTGSAAYAPGINVPYNIASRHGSTFVNGAVDGTALTVNTTPTALPYLQATDLNLGYDFMGTIGKFRVWSDDLTDTGIEEAST